MVEDKLFAAVGPSFWTLLLVFLLSLGLTAGQLIQLLVPARNWAGRLDRLGTVIGLFMAGLLSVEVVHQSDVWLGHSWQIPLAILIFCLAAVIPYVHWRLSKMPSRTRRLPKLLLRVTLAALCVASAGWSGERYYGLNAALNDMGLLFATPGEMAKVRRFVAVTDAGQRLVLHQWKVADEEFREYSARAATRLSGMSEATIQRTAADRRANCHGWVFTGGRYLLTGTEVEQILQDNGYAVADNPQADDVVIYRDDAGQIMHTGLVRGILDDGTVMVESKFGVDGRYLHQPKDQPFGQNFAYYRSSRSGHCVTIESTSGAHATSDKPRVVSPSRRGARFPRAQQADSGVG